MGRFTENGHEFSMAAIIPCNTANAAIGDPHTYMAAMKIKAEQAMIVHDRTVTTRSPFVSPIAILPTERTPTKLQATVAQGPLRQCRLGKHNGRGC
jgi:hypothetical protein